MAGVSPLFLFVAYIEGERFVKCVKYLYGTVAKYERVAVSDAIYALIAKAWRLQVFMRNS